MIRRAQLGAGTMAWQEQMAQRLKVGLDKVTMARAKLIDVIKVRARGKCIFHTRIVFLACLSFQISNEYRRATVSVLLSLHEQAPTLVYNYSYVPCDISPPS